jgi:hypothetical protein
MSWEYPLSRQSWPEGDELQPRLNSWSKLLVVRQSPAGKHASAETEYTVEIRYKATTGENIAKRNLPCPVTRRRVRE